MNLVYQPLHRHSREGGNPERIVRNHDPAHRQRSHWTPACAGVTVEAERKKL